MRKIICGAIALMVMLSFGSCAYSGPVNAAASSTDQYYFPRSGDNPKAALISVIDSAHTTLDVAIYSITDKDIGNAIVADKRRGVTVRVISDKTEAKGKSQRPVLNAIKAAGISVKINSHSGLMHLKVTIADGSVCTTGSFNYTAGAEKENDEIFVVVSDKAAAQRFDKEFNAMWADTKAYTNY
jgi:phosphatidylserine/phosphatidylglycerophosphate/cardiolipin synthase-like enzyme